jgi:hypothetical protein
LLASRGLLEFKLFILIFNEKQEKKNIIAMSIILIY